MWNSRWSQGDQRHESQRGELLSVWGGDRWAKPSRTRISQLFQDQLEYIFRLIEMPAQTKRESKCIWIRQGSQILSVLSFLANTWLPVPSIYKSIIDTTQNETEWPVRFKFCITLLHSNGRNHRHYSIDTFSENESPHNFSRENYINYLFI